MVEPAQKEDDEVARRQPFRSFLNRLRYRHRRVRVLIERGVPRHGLYGKDGVIIEEKLADDGALILTIRFAPDEPDDPPRDGRRHRRGRVVREWAEDELPSRHGLGRVIGPKADRRAVTQRRVLWLLTFTLSVIVVGTSIAVWRDFHPDIARDYYAGVIAPLFQLVLAIVTVLSTRDRP